MQSNAMEAVSLDDTLGEIKTLVKEDLREDPVIPVNSVEMYEVITDFGKMIGMDQTAGVDTRYKIVDRKMRPAAAPLPEDSLGRIKGVTTHPSLRDSADIGHQFTDKTLRELKIGGGDFLLPVKENRFRRMLERHWKAFAFSPEEIGCVDPTTVQPMVIFTTARALECQADFGTEGSHPRVDRAAQVESGDGYPRTVECPLF